MLKQPASSVLETREAYLVKRRSFQDSDISLITFHVSQATRTACLSILEECSPVVPHMQTIKFSRTNIILQQPANV